MLQAQTNILLRLTLVLMLICICLFSSTLLFAKEDPEPKSKLHQGKYRVLDWPELMPANELKRLEELMSMPIDHNAPPASEGEMSLLDKEREALWNSRNIRKEFNNQLVRIPGFIVPLETTSKGQVVEFFLAPFFGACIHVPPPPPNQMIFVKSKTGISQEELYEPYWVQGKLTTEVTENDLGTSAYQLQADHLEVFTFEDAESN